MVFMGFLASGVPRVATWVYFASIVRVIDGDTWEVERWLTPSVRETCVVRLVGANAPEKGTAAGRAALDWASAELPVGSTVQLVVESDDDRDRDHFGRLLASLTYEVDLLGVATVVDFGERLREAGFDVPRRPVGPRVASNLAAVALFAALALSTGGVGCAAPRCAGDGCSASNTVSVPVR